MSNFSYKCLSLLHEKKKIDNNIVLLDRLVNSLHERGVESTPYNDKY